MINHLRPTRPIDIRNGAIILTLYNQENVMVELPVKDTFFNHQFAVYLRQIDRQSKGDNNV